MTLDRLSLQPAPHNNSLSISKRPRTIGERAKVTRACDRCKKRKVKCNGKHPCEFCHKAKARCTYDSAYARGRVPVIPSTFDNETEHSAAIEDIITSPQQASDSRENCLPINAIEARQYATEPWNQHLQSSYLEPSVSTATSIQNSPKQSQADLHGHYIGPASGVSFLRRIQKRLDQAASFSQPSSIFTFGDPDLRQPDFSPDFFMMLPRDDAQRVVDRYFDFAMPTYRFLHRPTIQEWFVEFYDTFGTMRDEQKAPAKLALLFMVFAHGTVYMSDSDRPGPPDLSARYYLAAEHQLTREKGSIRLTSIQARLSQCYYLLTQSRINHSWSLFGTVSHLMLAIGLNRNRRPVTTSILSQVEAECCRRTFWCAYTLDVYLSLVLGRPRLFHDEDIDMELPKCAEDENLGVSCVGTPGLTTQPIMLAPLAHMKLARIIGKILRDLYSIKPISSDRRAVLTERLSRELSEWRVGLNQFLDIEHNSNSCPSPIFQRQRNILNLTYWHAIILTHRPFVLNNFAEYLQPSRRVSDEYVQTEESVQQCLLAAKNTMRMIDNMTRTHQMYRAFWTAAYFAFTANIVLYIYVILKGASSPDIYSDCLAAATQCQRQISEIAEKGSLPERYCLLLEELRREALRQTEHSNSPAVASSDTHGYLQEAGNSTRSAQINSDLGPTVNYMESTGDDMTGFTGMMPDSMDSSYADWGHFATMVSSGLGNLDVLVNDDPFLL